MVEKYTGLKIEPFNSPEYKMPTEVYFGRGQANKLPDVVDQSTFSKVVLVPGSHLLGSELISSLVGIGKVKLYPSRISNSDFESVNKLTNFCRSISAEAVIGIGGGAVLDSVKAAAVISPNGGAVEDYLVTNNRKIKKPGLYFIAAPTTSGTGSEVTPWSVVWGDKKYSLASSDFMFPDVAIVDPELTDDCPETVTATAGIDALCQSIEAYWNVNHNSTSDKYALESVESILSGLDDAVNNPSSYSRDQMAWGSLLGGLAFSNTATTICHSVSYPITLHWKVPHGQATSITLPEFIEYTFPVLESGRRNSILNAMGAGSDKEAADKVRSLMTSVGLKLRLSELSIPKEGIDVIVAEGFDPQRAVNAPRIPSPGELKKMLSNIF